MSYDRMKREHVASGLVANALRLEAITYEKRVREQEHINKRLEHKTLAQRELWSPLLSLSLSLSPSLFELMLLTL